MSQSPEELWNSDKARQETLKAREESLIKYVKRLRLESEYRALSEVEEFWEVKTSKHRAYLFIISRMREILKELASIEDKLTS